MTVHITNLNNMGGTASLAQAGVVSVARKMGIKEMGISYYHLEPDFYNELDHKLDGIIAGLHHGDTVIFQYPSWAGVNYDECFINKIKTYRDTKLVIFVHDIQKMILNAEQWMLDWEIRNLNKADYFIMPSKEMHEYLISCGLNSNIDALYQTIWEMPDEPLFSEHGLVRRFIFTGNYNRFPFLANYHGKTPIEQYQRDVPPRQNDESYVWKGFVEPDKLMEETAKGGFGLVWSDDEYFDSYYSMNQPHKLGFNLSAGIPVIVRKGCVHEEFVVKHGLGFAVNSIEEADQIVQSISLEEYEQLYKNVKNIQYILLNGGYTRKLLEDTIIHVLENSCDRIIGDDLPIEVMNNEDSLTYIMKSHCSVARFGDGEFDIISGRSIPYQTFDSNLQRELKEIVGTQSNEKLLVCMPDVFEDLDRYNDACKSFWKSHLKANKKLYLDCCKAEWYGSTNLSRPYMDLADKSQAKGYFERLISLWDRRDILIVEGINSRSGVGNDLFANANSIERIICPSRDAYAALSLIENEIRNYGNGKLILLMLGPTAKVISYHLSKEGFWLIDLGHIDSEYEWYKMGATTKVKLTNKHTAEHNYDENIVFDENQDYDNQIVSKIELRSH